MSRRRPSRAAKSTRIIASQQSIPYGDLLAVLSAEVIDCHSGVLIFARGGRPTGLVSSIQERQAEQLHALLARGNEAMGILKVKCHDGSADVIVGVLPKFAGHPDAAAIMRWAAEDLAERIDGCVHVEPASAVKR
jgi:hypothetical protein